MRLVRKLLFLVCLLVGFETLGADPTYFWDEPEYLVRQGARFPQAVDNGRTAVALWQERKSAAGWPQTFLSVMVRNQKDLQWTTRRNVLGPFPLVGTEAQIYSAVLTPKGTLWVAVLGQEDQVLIYRSDDGAATFQEQGRLTAKGNLVVPRLFLVQDEDPLLVVNQADASSFRIFESRPVGGRWTDLEVVTAEPQQRQSFQPWIVRSGNRLTMVYQTLFTGQRITYQIFRKDSVDGGVTWSAPVRLSDFADELGDNPDLVDNQRPGAIWYHNRLFVVWERRTGQTQSLIEMVSYTPDGRRLDHQALTAPTFTARNPIFYTFQDRLRLAWFDNRNETYSLFLSAWDPVLGWDTPERLTDETGNSVFGQPAHLGEDLYFFWQNNFGENTGVEYLKPLRHVDPPTLRAVDFRPGIKTNKQRFTVEVQFPKDLSGIRGFVTVLTQDPTVEPFHGPAMIPKDHLFRADAPHEGLWYLAVEVLDYAGNWSVAARIPYDFKTTPPGPVNFDRPATDAYGYLTSNTFQLGWHPSTPDAVAYSWQMRRVGDALTPHLLASLQNPEPPGSPTGTDAFASATNVDDGLWALAVAAFDEAGNRGPVSTQYFRLNKFVPYTVIDSVDTQQDVFGRVQIAIHGRGFTAGGALTHVYIDKKGQPPYDYDVTAERFHLASDRLVDGINLEGLAEGVYRVGVGHPQRGTVFTGLILKVEPSGVVKIGDFRNLDQTTWEFFRGVSLFFSVHAVYFWIVMVFLGLTAGASARLLTKTWAERWRIDQQTHRWVADKDYKWARRAGSSAMKTKGLSLTFKFAVSILGLMSAVILMLSLTLGFFITENSQLTLGTALQQRTQVLLESLATGARTYLPADNISELGNLPPQIAAMEGDALYATITGPSREKKAGLSYVYASNDPDLRKKTDTDTLIPGVTRLKDDIEPLWEAMQKDLNRQAAAAVGDAAHQIDQLSREALPLAIKTDAASRAQVQAYDEQISALKRQVINKLAEIGGKARSLPAFDTKNLLSSSQKKYLFYQPFLYLVNGDPTYVRGLIRIEVSSEKIEKQISASRDQLIEVTAIVALVALALGLVGAFILSALTINPIRQLVTGVEKIRDTDDKSSLSDHVIDIQTRDELQDLAATVNQMTRGLVDGANKTQDLTKGKVEQKTLFIPLDKDQEAETKLTTFHRDLDDIEVFAYYEGAKLVSGDLYEFRQLDTQNGKNPHSPWYGIMKGDVSGKGVEAGMIMAIAAMFVTTFFRRWTVAKDGKDTKVQALLYQINDTIEPILAEAGRGLFVALNVGILNAKTGSLRFSQAGDNLLHIWRGRTQEFESVDLKKTVSVGAMPSEDHGIRYENRDLVVGSGDTLLYFTDGIEESQSAFRNEKWEPVAYFDPADPSTLTFPGNRKQVPVFEGGPLRDIQAIDTEDFGPERIEAVITAYFRREVYELKKRNWAHPELSYHFDFSRSDGSAAQLVTALISLDRIFRLVPDPKATADDYVDLDLVQDRFLRECFVEFDQYFKDGFKTEEQGERGKDIVDAEGFKLKGAKRVPLWERGDAAQGDTVDEEGYKLVDGDRVPLWERADPKKKEPADPEGFRLVGGKRVPAFERGDPSKGDVVDPEGYRLVGGKRILKNPGFIRYTHLKEDHQFDDLTLLAIRRK